MTSRASSVSDECLGAEDGEECEAFGVLGAGLGGVDDDAQVAARDAEHVAIQRQGPHLRVIDGLTRRLVPAHGSGIPHLDEPVAVRAQLRDQAQ